MSGIAPLGEGPLPRLSRLRQGRRGRTPGPPVDARHQEDLETLLELMRANVSLESRCQVGDGDGAQRDAFAAHFARLGASIEDWNERVIRAQAAPVALWRWLAHETARRGIVEPPFMVGAVIDHVAVVVLELARAGTLTTHRDLVFRRFGEVARDPAAILVYHETSRMARLAPAPHAEEAVAQAERLIQRLLDDALACAEAEEVARSRDVLLDLKHDLLEWLATEAAVDPLPLALGCPVCRPDPDGSAPAPAGV